MEPRITSVNLNKQGRKKTKIYFTLVADKKISPEKKKYVMETDSGCNLNNRGGPVGVNHAHDQNEAKIRLEKSKVLMTLQILL